MQTTFGFQTNKGHDWLEATIISNYKAMCLAHSDYVIDHMIGEGQGKKLIQQVGYHECK